MEQQLTAEFSRRDLRRLVIPLMIEQLLAILVGMCDSVMVSQVGEAAMSAVSLVDSVNVLLINAFSALALYLLLPVILWLYHVSPEARGHVERIMGYNTGFTAAVWCCAFALPQTLRAAGDTRFTLLVSSVSMWTLRVGLGVLLCRAWGLGVLGVWLAMYADWILRAALFTARYLGHRWETMALRD